MSDPVRLDRELPYAQVYGCPGVDFQQTDTWGKVHFFNAGGYEVEFVSPKDPAEEEKALKEKQESEEHQRPAVQHVKASAPAKEVPTKEERLKAKTEGKELEDMHHMQLRAMVSMYGGTWTTREDAIAFLREGEKTEKSAA